MRRIIQKSLTFLYLIFFLFNAQQVFSQCEASYDFQTYTGPIPAVGGITFFNYSIGDFDELSWDFGDGSYDSQAATSVTHFYQESGSYEVVLSIWSGAPDNCYAEYSQVIDVFISEDPCDQIDCVWPGDTNKDGVATLEDVINIGIGYGMNGPPRDSISNDWTGQFATDWEAQNNEGIDYKHFDCNGNGTIDVNDILAIQNNFVKLENGVSVTETNGVPITLSFDVDTVVVTDENQDLVINAGLNFGSSNIPMEEIYGVVLYLNYPKQYVKESSTVDFNYNENSFFGDYTSALPMARNILNKGQMDIVLTRSNGLNISGQGRVGSVKFIIDSDIIDGRIENEGEFFAVGINVVKAIDVDGNIIDVSLSEEPAGVFFQNGISTNTIDIIDDNSIQVFPNPVSETLLIQLSEELNPEEVELFNLVGQRMIYNEMTNHNWNINVSQLPKGIYILKIKTQEGIGSKRIIVE